MTIQDYNHPDCLHGFPEWTERQLDRNLSMTGCPSCQAERIKELEAERESQSDDYADLLKDFRANQAKVEALEADLHGARQANVWLQDNLDETEAKVYVSETGGEKDGHN